MQESNSQAMAREETMTYRKKLLKFVIDLRNVGMEAKFHIYDILLDPCKSRKRKSQFIAVALVSKEEIISENFTVLKEFTDYLHEIKDSAAIVSRIVHHERVAVAMNAGEKYFFEHGECRIFDPTRHFLYKIIDSEALYRNKRKKQTLKANKLDKGGQGVLENMENAYINIFNDFVDAVLLLFSFYIPCSIDFHDCARLLHEFIEASGCEMVIGYEHVHDLTDLHVSMKWLNMKHVTILCNSEIEKEMCNQVTSLIKKNECGIESEFSCVQSDEEDIFDDYHDRVDNIKKKSNLRKFRKEFCRKILKEFYQK